MGGVVLYSLAGAVVGVLLVLAADRVRRRLERRQARALRRAQFDANTAERPAHEPTQ